MASAAVSEASVAVSKPPFAFFDVIAAVFEVVEVVVVFPAGVFVVVEVARVVARVAARVALLFLWLD